MSAAVPLRVGFIGAGGNTRLRHLPGFRAEKGVELAAVANRSRASSERIAAEWGIPRVFDDWRALAADPEIDAVCIGAWPNLHCEATCVALEAGKHVLCEARMARDWKEAEAMAAVSRGRPDLVAQIVPSPFTLAVDDWIAGKLRGGALGRVLEVRACFGNGALRDPQAPLTWRLDPELSGRNTMVLGILHEAILRWIDLPDLEVTASAGWGASERPDPETGAARRTVIPESLQVAARASNGIRLLYDLSQLRGGPPRNWIQIDGSSGSLRIDLGGGSMALETGEGREVLSIPDGWDVEGEFVRSVRTGAPVRRTAFADGLRYMRFTEDVWDAWQRPGRDQK